jgi:hypothetical protein
VQPIHEVVDCGVVVGRPGEVDATYHRQAVKELLLPVLSPVLFSLYVNDMPSPSHHVELVLYADNTAIIATSRKTTLLFSYL